MFSAAFYVEISSLVALTVAAVASEKWLPQKLDSLTKRQRESPSTGLALGILTIPWVSAALSAKYTRQETGIGLASTNCLRDSLASSIFILSSLHLTAFMPLPSTAHTTRRISTKKEMNLIYSLLKILLVHGILMAMSAKLTGSPFSIITGRAYYQWLKLFPKTFTLGESIVVVQGIALLTKTLILEFIQSNNSGSSTETIFITSWPALFAAVVLLASVVLGLLFATLLKLRSKSPIFSALLGLFTLLVVAFYAYKPLVDDLVNFIFSHPQRIQVFTSWIALLAVSLPSMLLLSRSGRIPNIILRKGYHILAVALFLPALLTQPQLLGIALACAFAALAVVEVLRTGSIPGISTRIHSFMGSFVDERDAGVVFITHFALLVGMALPVWLSNAMDTDTNTSSSNFVDTNHYNNTIWPAALAGILATGLGDAAASVVGSQFGRVPIAPNSKKTVEGTLAAAVTVMIAWLGLVYYQYIPEMQCIWDFGNNSTSILGWAVLGAVTVLNSVLEASTEQLDNLFIPLHYFALLLCVFK